METLFDPRSTNWEVALSPVRVPIAHRMLGALALSTLAMCAVAQPSPGRLASPPGDVADVSAITPASAFLAEPTPISRWLGNAPLVLNSEGSAAARAARKGLKQIRMFRLPPGKDVPDPHLAFDDCDIYVTAVIAIPPQTNEEPTAIMVGTFESPSWLVPDAERNEVRPGRWLVIMEQYEDTSRVFRLKKKSRSAYFSGGWMLVLQGAPGRTYTRDEIKAAVGNMITFKDVEAEARINNSTRVCHIAKVTQVADADLPEHQLVGCLPVDGADL